MTAEEELAALEAAEAIEPVLFASEPMVVNPSAIDVDTHGRVWVAEIQWYRSKAKMDPPADRIKVLEDVDGDGRADRATVFAENVFAPMSICVAGDKVYVATSPDLWVYEDADGDLRADGPPKKLLTGFGGFNHDHGAHSLVLGPDHKWWMAHGDGGFDVRGVDGSHIKYSWGAMLRGELDGSKLETVAVNFRNSYELCVSSFGEVFCSDNDNDGNESVRICWILEGGNYGWYGQPPMRKQEVARRLPEGLPLREGWHFRAYEPGYVPGTLVTGFGSPCGICFYEGDAFGGRLRGAPLHADAGPQVVRRYPHEVAGYGMKADSQVVLTTERDRYFRPDDVCVAPNGGIYVSDWYDGGVGGHAYNDPDRGRIFFLKPKGKDLSRREKPGPYETVDEALVALASPNLATQYLARERLLASGEEAAPSLVALLSGENRDLRARALWLLDRLGGDAREHVVEMLADEDSTYRALAVRILRRHGDAYEQPILDLVNDESSEVRREVMLGIRNWSSDAAVGALAKLVGRFDGSDRYELEAIRVAAGDRAGAVFDQLAENGPDPQSFSLLWALDAARAESLLAELIEAPDVDEEAAERAAELLALSESQVIGGRLLQVVLDDERPLGVRRAAAAAVTRNAAAAWRGTLASLDGDSLERLLRSELGAAAIDWARAANLSAIGPAALQVVEDEGADSNLRREALELLGEIRASDALPVLRRLAAGGGEYSGTARNVLVRLLDGPSIRGWLSAEAAAEGDRVALIERLMRQDRGPWVVYSVLEDAKAKIAEEAGDRAIELAADHPDANVRALFAKYLPADAARERLGESVTAADILALQGDEQRGRRIFFQSSAAQCKNCHAVAGQGQDVGPELTFIGRKYERAALLETILEPSKAISHEYVPYLVLTVEGQVHLGYLVQGDEQAKVIKTAEGREIRIPAADVEEMIQQQVSLMPKLVLSQVSAQDAADLLEYLTTLK